MCAHFGKWPHEFGQCYKEEQEYIKAWWNEKTDRENKAIKQAQAGK
jgi:hypothetical protein